MSTKEDNKRDRSKEPARGTHYYGDPDELIIIGLDTKDGAEHPLYDPRIHAPIDDAEVRNIEFYGVRKPVVVRKNDGRLEVVDGRGRVRKARIAKANQLKRGEEPVRVPYILEKGTDDHLFGLSRALNIHKNDGPMATAQNVQRYLAMGRSVQEAADTFGVSEQTIRNYQSLFDAHKDVIDAMVTEEITTTAALQIVALPKEEQKEVLDEVKKEQRETGKKATVQSVKRKVAEKQGKQTNTPKERIDRARNLLLKFTLKPTGEKTKEEMLATMERLSRVLLGMGLDKLADSGDEE